MKHQDSYEKGIIEALNKLIEANNAIFDGAVGIALHGELKEWSDGVPDGETHTFEFALIKQSEDPNIKLLIALMEEIESMYHTICSLNGIDKK